MTTVGADGSESQLSGVVAVLIAVSSYSLALSRPLTTILPLSSFTAEMTPPSGSTDTLPSLSTMTVPISSSLPSPFSVLMTYFVLSVGSLISIVPSPLASAEGADGVFSGISCGVVTAAGSDVFDTAVPSLSIFVAVTLYSVSGSRPLMTILPSLSFTA